MSNQQNNKAVLVGVGLIGLVGIITFARPLLQKGPSDEKSPVQREEEQQYPTITADGLQGMIKEKSDILVIDTRPLEEFKREHIFGSINADQDTVGHYLEKVNPDTQLVIVGANPNDFTAKLMANLIKQRGYDQYFLLSGGMEAWIGGNNRTIRLGNPDSLSDQAKIKLVSPDDLKSFLDQRISTVAIIDLRSPQSFADGHIPQAINIPGNELESKIGMIPPTGEIVYYAQTEIETFQWGVSLFDLGFMNAQALEGGISAWRSKNFPIEK